MGERFIRSFRLFRSFKWKRKRKKARLHEKLSQTEWHEMKSEQMELHPVTSFFIPPVPV